MLNDLYFDYIHRSVKMVMVPVTIAQNNNLHNFFSIFISGRASTQTGTTIVSGGNIKISKIKLYNII